MKPRYYSLDVFRGATVCLMILVNNPGSWSHIYGPLEHAPWNGLTPTDLVFPFFLFAVGNAMAFVLPRLEAAGEAAFWRKVIKRTLLIYGIGLFLNWFPFVRWEGDSLHFIPWTWADPVTGKPQGIRILGVLPRIAFCYFFASVIVHYLKGRKALFAGLAILLVYWVILLAGNPQDPFSMTGYFGNVIDFKVLHEAHMYKGEGIPFDPEGILSTFPAIVQVIFGYLVGTMIVNQSQYKWEEGQPHPLYPLLTRLFVTAVGLLAAGYAWDLLFPVNKKIWTSSYVIVTTGMAICILCSMIYVIEIRGKRGWLTRFFDVFGKNALFVFALSVFMPRSLRLIRIPDGVSANGTPIYISPWNWLYERVYKFIPGEPQLGSLVYALTVIAFMWLVCYILDRKKIYIKV